MKSYNDAPKTYLFKTPHDELFLIGKVVDRYQTIDPNFHRQSTMMDLDAVNSNGCPLDFGEMLNYSVEDLVHDIVGIRSHLDRETGTLRDCFVPRCAKLQDEDDATRPIRVITLQDLEARPSLADLYQFQQLLEKGCQCRWCHAELPKEAVSFGEHDGGVMIPNTEVKHWIGVVCPQCRYQWAWWKIVRWEASNGR